MSKPRLRSLSIRLLLLFALLFQGAAAHWDSAYAGTPAGFALAESGSGDRAAPDHHHGDGHAHDLPDPAVGTHAHAHSVIDHSHEVPGYIPNAALASPDVAHQAIAPAAFSWRGAPPNDIDRPPNAA